MAQPSAPPQVIPLVRSQLADDGVHSSKALSRAVHRGLKHRLRHGVYVDAEQWADAPPWVRYQLAISAVALREPKLIFCRESALTLHGLPLLLTPRT